MAKIKWGRKVRPTKLAIKNGALIEGDWGIFISYNPRRTNSVRVIKVGTITPIFYHIDFWEVEDE